ncbi:MAG: hypothetical protein GY841_08510 [FCB group bacterium]|nr:hypothetical protein [FCB group bacterium]
MLRSLFSILLILTLPLFYLSCSSDDGDNGIDPPPPAPTRVEVEAHQNPGLGSVNSAIWDSLEAAQITIGTDIDYIANDLTSEKTVQMKALVADDTLLYIWAKWSDNDQDNRFGEIHGSWINNQVQWVINNEDTVFRNEDRFYIMFDNGGTGGADCAQFCHAASSAAGRKMYSAGANADIWQWKAHRTGLVGLADDMHMTTTMISGDPQDQIGDSLYFRNFKEWPGNQPRYMAPGGPGDTTTGLLEGEWVDFVNSNDWMIFYVDQPPTALPVPGYVLYNLTGADGSRWDVETVSDYDGSAWTVVFCRRFDTGDAGDIEFDFTTLDSVMISIGITNNSGIKHHGRQPFPLVFMP